MLRLVLSMLRDFDFQGAIAACPGGGGGGDKGGAGAVGDEQQAGPGVPLAVFGSLGVVVGPQGVREELAELLIDIYG